MTLLIFLAVIAVLIFIHELGHFLVAKKVGIKVEEFAIGFPPRVWSKKKDETLYSLNLIPIGGFVRLYGEEEEVKKNRTQAFYHKGRLVRALVVTAGVMMNFLFGVVAFALVFAVYGIPKETGMVRVEEVGEATPAYQAGLLKNDIILSVAGQSVYDTKAFRKLIEENKGKEVELVVKRGDGFLSLFVIPRSNPPSGQGPLGIIVSSSIIVHPPILKLPFVAAWYGLQEAFYWVGNIFSGIGSAVSQLTRGVVPRDITGPVGIFQATDTFARTGFISLVWFLGVLSINLAVVNILPFPALDGGRAMFILIEAIFGRRVIPTVERIAHSIGLVFLFALLLLITFKDITQLLSGGFDFLKDIK
jgi:regulator of sigma E protease